MEMEIKSCEPRSLKRYTIGLKSSFKKYNLSFEVYSLSFITFYIFS